MTTYPQEARYIRSQLETPTMSSTPAFDTINQASGVYPISPTAFHPDGAVDRSSMDRLTDFYLEIGATGITVLGQLGEAPKLSQTESVAIAQAMVKRANGIPVIVGVSAPGFASMRELTHEVMSIGASGVMIAPPNTLCRIRGCCSELNCDPTTCWPWLQTQN